MKTPEFHIAPIDVKSYNSDKYNKLIKQITYYLPYYACMDIKKGVDRLLESDNVEIIHLLLKEGCVDSSFIIHRAKDVYNTADKIWTVKTVNLLYENDMIDMELSQIFLELICRSNMRMEICLDTIKKLINIGAIMPAKYLIKLPYEDFVEQMETRYIKIDAEFEINSVLHNACVGKLEWIREHSIEDEMIIPKILVNGSSLTGSMISFYFDKAKNNSVLADKIIMAIIYNYNFRCECKFWDHTIAEELSFFIIIFFEIHEIPDDAPVKKSLLRMIHPDTKKYAKSNAHEYQDQTKIRNICSGTFEEFSERVTEHAKILYCGIW